MVCPMMDRMCSRPSRARFSAARSTSDVTPWILMSIWKPVIPSRVPATLKSMWPRWSSSPRMSLSTTNLSSPCTRPIAIPATGFFMGTPALSRLRVVPQTVAIEEEPLDSRISETTRTV